MEHYISQYISSTWGMATNALVVILFGLAAYDAYAKRWGAMTGRYSTTGRITWSELDVGNSHPLISYSYHVDGKLYNGTITPPLYGREVFVAAHPKGMQITVFYSNKAPEFSKASKPPNHLNVVGSTLLVYLFAPLLLVNPPSMFIYWLVYHAS